MSISLFSQDFEVYPHLQDDLIKVTPIPHTTTIYEYRTLSRNIRMLDAFYAILVPGYIHYYIGDKKTGNRLLAWRIIGYTGLTAVYISNKARGESFININPFHTSSDENEYMNIVGNWKLKKEDVVTTISLGIIITTYLYDWIKGKVSLQKQQETIRYKFGLKATLEKERLHKNTIPAVGMYIKF